MRICHVADTHLGYYGGKARTPDGRNLRRVDFNEAWLDACRKIKALKPDLVIHAGDPFHQPRPPYSAIYVFSQGLEILRPIPTIVIAGNHDTSKLRTEKNALDLIQIGRDWVHVVSGFEEDGISLMGGLAWCVPWGRLMSKKPLTIHPDARRWPNVLVTHGDAPTVAFANQELGEGCISKEVLDRGWDYVAMGHIHQCHSPWRENVWYAGSTERCGWSDFGATPGFLEVELSRGESPSVTHHPVVHRHFEDLGKIEQSDPTAALLEIFLRLDQAPAGCVARVRVDGLSRRDGRTVKRATSEVGRVAEFQVLLPENLVEAMNHTEVKFGKLSIPEVFREFVDSRTFGSSFNKDVFLSKGLAAIAAAEAAEKDVEENQ